MRWCEPPVCHSKNTVGQQTLRQLAQRALRVSLQSNTSIAGRPQLLADMGVLQVNMWRIDGAIEGYEAVNQYSSQERMLTSTANISAPT